MPFYGTIYDDGAGLHGIGDVVEQMRNGNDNAIFEEAQEGRGVLHAMVLMVDARMVSLQGGKQGNGGRSNEQWLIQQLQGQVDLGYKLASGQVLVTLKTRPLHTPLSGCMKPS
jgi:hypothetical protein